MKFNRLKRDLFRFGGRIGRRSYDFVADQTATRFLASLRENRRKMKLFRRWAIAFVLLGLAAAATPRTVQHWKTWQTRRMANQALVLIQQKQWLKADQKIRDAVTIGSNVPEELTLAIARLLSGTGQKAAAIEFWQKIEDSPLLTGTDHRDYAESALAVNDLDKATQQIDLLTASHHESLPKDRLLSGELALARGMVDSANRAAEKVLDDPRATTVDVIGAAGLIFKDGVGNDSSCAHACSRVAQIAREPSDPGALDALILLAEQRLTSKSAATPSSDPSAVCYGAITLSEIADLLDRHPSARGCHHIMAYDVKLRINPSRADELVAEAVRLFGHSDDETLVALATWLSSQRRMETVLQVVTPARANERRELFIDRIDALAALGRYKDAESLLLDESSVIDPTSQHMRLAVIKAATGEAVAATNEWERALDEAANTRQLLALAAYAEKHGEFSTADAAYDRVVIKQSSLKFAYVAHLRLAETMEETSKAHDIAAKIAELWPNDVSSRMHEVYLRLLLGTSDQETKLAESEAQAVLQRNPWHVGARMVLSLARLKLGRYAGALEAISQNGSNESVKPYPLAVRAAALTANGWKDKAVEEAQKLATVQLLPEERALISPLLTAN